MIGKAIIAAIFASSMTFFIPKKDSCTLEHREYAKKESRDLHNFLHDKEFTHIYIFKNIYRDLILDKTCHNVWQRARVYLSNRWKSFSLCPWSKEYTKNNLLIITNELQKYNTTYNITQLGKLYQKTYLVEVCIENRKKEAEEAKQKAEEEERKRVYEARLRNNILEISGKIFLAALFT
jgi:hypothetical protein